MRRVKASSPFLNELIGFGLLLILWALAAVFYPGYVIPSPWAVIRIIPSLLTLENLQALGLTLYRTFIGFGLALILGSGLAYLTCGTRFSNLIISLQQAIQVLPAIIVGVIFVIIFGVGDGTPIMLTVIMTLPFIFINTLYLLENPDPHLDEYLRSVKADRTTRWKALLKPQMIKAGYNNLAAGLSMAIKIVIMGEFIGSQNGIGYLLNRARLVFEMKEVFFYLLILVLVTLVFEAIIVFIFSHPLKKYFYA